jgi:hypothetical protein
MEQRADRAEEIRKENSRACGPCLKYRFNDGAAGGFQPDCGKIRRFSIYLGFPQELPDFKAWFSCEFRCSPHPFHGL